jgi:hypothetical protein
MLHKTGRNKMTTVNIFRELRNKYNSWGALKEYLTSDDGGKLLVVENDIDPRFCIVRYDKTASNCAVLHVGAFRSVVWDTLLNLPVSVAPFKALEGVPTLEQVHDNSSIIQEFVEGTMLQAFAGHESPEIRLTTRTKFGAHTRFYSKRNFSELIKDTPQYGELNQILPVASLCKERPYIFTSLVLQHPEHRVVSLVPWPKLYVVSLGVVSDDGTVIISEDPYTWPEPARSYAIPTYINKNTDINALMTQYGWMWQGLVVKNVETLQRFRVISPLYSSVKELRGNESDDMLRFLRLRKAGQIQTYIYYYPHVKDIYESYELKMREQTQSLFEEYCAIYKNKSATKKNLKDVGWPHRKNVRAIHDIYRNQLKPAQESVKKEVVVHYMNNIDIVKQRAFLVTPVGGKITTEEDVVLDTVKSA